MYKFNENQFKTQLQTALSLRKDINELLEPIYKSFSNLCFLGIGGTYASCMQVCNHMQEKSNYEVICQSAAEYVTTGNRRINQNTLMIISSVSGTTKEIVEAVHKAKEHSVYVLGFIDNKDSILAKLVDKCISFNANEQLKFFMVADYFMYHEGVFNEYEDYYNNLEEHLADALIETSKLADSFGYEFATKHHEDDLHYFIGAGNQWGATYSYGMCYVEEQHWLKSKTIHASEFFHGTFEVIDKNSNVTVFLGEDKQRPLSERVKNFLPQICANYTFIDTLDYPLTGIKQEYRQYISHLVMRQICERIDVYIEKINCHPMNIRRYYRQLDY